MHVLPLPFGLALAVLPRREAKLLRPEKEKEPIRVYRGPSHRERVLTDPKFAPFRREIV
jgi:hypothetical protein